LGNVARILIDDYARHAARPAVAVRRDGRWVTSTYAELEPRAAAGALALIAAGVKPGDRVAIVARTSVEWMLADQAIALAGGVIVPVYPTLPAASMAHLLSDSGASRAIVHGEKEAALVRAAAPGLPLLSLDPLPGVPAALPPPAAGDRVADPRLLERVGALGDASLVSFLYTSGTTGKPKAAVYDHRAAHGALMGLCRNLGIREDDVALSFLPMSHGLGRGSVIAFFHTGALNHFGESLDTVAADFASARPTCAFTVPRVFEKAYERIRGRAHASGIGRRVFPWAVRAGRDRWSARRAGRAPSALARARHSVADRLLFSKVRAGLGGRVRVLWSGGASLRAEIAEFFALAGVPIRDVYGMSEFGLSHITPEGELRFGSCGKIAPGYEARIAEDGEILVRYANSMAGYHGLPDDTRAFRDGEGWMHTGDIGRVEDGWFYVTDRKKALLVLSNGKKIAPGPIEAALCAQPLIQQAVVLGEGRSYLVALVVPDREQARARGLDEAALAAAVQSAVDEVNRDLPSFETVKRFVLLPRALSEADGELTPTLKVKRKVIDEKYADVIESLYAG